MESDKIPSNTPPNPPRSRGIQTQSKLDRVAFFLSLLCLSHTLLPRHRSALGNGLHSSSWQRFAHFQQAKGKNHSWILFLQFPSPRSLALAFVRSFVLVSRRRRTSGPRWLLLNAGRKITNTCRTRRRNGPGENPTLSASPFDLRALADIWNH